MPTLLKTTFLGLVLFFSCNVVTFAMTATLVTDVDVFEKAKVVKVFDVGTTTVPGFDSSTKTQTVTALVLEGVDTGRVVTFKNDYIQLNEGDLFYVRHQSNHLDGSDYWTVSDPYRLNVLVVLIIIFVGFIFVFGGIQGVRGLVSLIGSFVLIFYALIPSLYQGYSVILVSIGVSSLIIIAGSYITHGFTRTTTSAVIGMIITVLITGVFAYYAVYSGKLSGYSQEESMYLNLNTRGGIDMVGLLFGGIIIGLLGVLYDIAIGQAVAVEELFRAGSHLKRKEVYVRAIRIGREHIGALVNTLAIAYVGASLPLFLLIQSSTAGTMFIINSEVISTEVIRILVGSIGLILAVPVTTLIASYMLYGKTSKESRNEYSHHH